MSLASASSFRRSGPRDERRRRLLLDEHDLAEVAPAARLTTNLVTNARSVVQYDDRQYLACPTRVVDLVPRRWTVLVAILVGLAATALGLVLLHNWEISRFVAGQPALVGFQLGRPGSLGGWFLALVLLMSTATALVIYGIRRRRADDYQGRYRIWGWAALCWFAMATDQITGLHDAYRQLLVSLTGWVIYRDGILWVVLTCLAILVPIGSRLILDMRPNKLGISLLLLAATAQLVSLLNLLHWLPGLPSDQAPVWLFGGEAFGCAAVLATMLVHARWVLLESEGLLPTREKKVATTAESTDADSGVTSSQESKHKKVQLVDPPHATLPANHVSLATETDDPDFGTAGAASSVITSPSAGANGKLSKAERKALKERLARERLER